jgi:hypothetical protein
LDCHFLYCASHRFYTLSIHRRASIENAAKLYVASGCEPRRVSQCQLGQSVVCLVTAEILGYAE